MIDGLPLETLNPFYRALLGKYSVNRWLSADAEVAQWNRKCRDYLLHIVKRLDEEGIRLAVGSDAGTMYMSPGDSTHLEMALMIEAGLSHATVLRAATLTAAETLGIEDRYGTAEIGRVADLVVVDANPLEDLGALQQPRAVIKAGQWISSGELKKLKESGENPSGFYVSLGRLLEDLLSRKLH